MNITLYKRNINYYKKKTCILNVFNIVRYQNSEVHGNIPIRGNRTTFPESYIFSVFNVLARKMVKKKTVKKKIVMENKYRVFVSYFLRQKHQNAYKLYYMGNQNDITRSIYYHCFFFLAS